jgi:hypothetical protein
LPSSPTKYLFFCEFDMKGEDVKKTGGQWLKKTVFWTLCSLFFWSVGWFQTYSNLVFTNFLFTKEITYIHIYIHSFFIHICTYMFFPWTWSESEA